MSKRLERMLQKSAYHGAGTGREVGASSCQRMYRAATSGRRAAVHTHIGEWFSPVAIPRENTAPRTHINPARVVVDDGRVLSRHGRVAEHVVAALLVAAKDVHDLRRDHVRGAVARVAVRLEPRVGVRLDGGTRPVAHTVSLSFPTVASCDPRSAYQSGGWNSAVLVHKKAARAGVSATASIIAPVRIAAERREKGPSSVRSLRVDGLQTRPPLPREPCDCLPRRRVVVLGLTCRLTC